jgi:hypothetical protein
MSNSSLPNRDAVIEDAKKRIAQFQERADEFEEQQRRLRDGEGEYGDDDSV